MKNTLTTMHTPPPTKKKKIEISLYNEMLPGISSASVIIKVDNHIQWCCLKVTMGHVTWHIWYSEVVTNYTISSFKWHIIFGFSDKQLKKWRMRDHGFLSHSNFSCWMKVKNYTKLITLSHKLLTIKACSTDFRFFTHPLSPQVGENNL